MTSAEWALAAVWLTGVVVGYAIRSAVGPIASATRPVVVTVLCGLAFVVGFGIAT